MQKIFLQYKTTKRAFKEMNHSKDGFIDYAKLQQMVENWGFEATESSVSELFNWLDYDKDGLISYEDLRSTAGREIAP